MQISFVDRKKPSHCIFLVTLLQVASLLNSQLDSYATEENNNCVITATGEKLKMVSEKKDKFCDFAFVSLYVLSGWFGRMRNIYTSCPHY